MDSALEKVGLYDFFGVFLAGIFFIAITLSLGLPLPFPLAPTDIVAINLILFTLEAYFIGIILQEISSTLDKHVFRTQKSARRTFLNDNNKVAENNLDFKASRKYANEILKKSNDLVQCIDGGSCG